MDFGTNKTPAEIINEGAFEGTYFRNFYLDVNGKWYKNSRKEFATSSPEQFLKNSPGTA